MIGTERRFKSVGRHLPGLGQYQTVENTILNDLKQHGIVYNHTFGGGGKLSITRMSSDHSRRL